MSLLSVFGQHGASNPSSRDEEHQSRSPTLHSSRSLHPRRTRDAGRFGCGHITARRDSAQTHGRRLQPAPSERADGSARGLHHRSPGALPGSEPVIRLAQQLFEEKKREIEAAIGPDTALHAKKWAFLRSVLTNQDLREPRARRLCALGWTAEPRHELPRHHPAPQSRRSALFGFARRRGSDLEPDLPLRSRGPAASEAVLESARHRTGRRAVHLHSRRSE